MSVLLQSFAHKTKTLETLKIGRDCHITVSEHLSDQLLPKYKNLNLTVALEVNSVSKVIKAASILHQNGCV